MAIALLATFVGTAFANWNYNCPNHGSCQTIQGPTENIYANQIIDYTRWGDGGNDQIWAGGYLLAQCGMPSNNYQVTCYDSAYYTSYGYFHTGYTDKLAGSEW